MSVSFEGIGELAATFKTSGTVETGDVVKIAGNGTAAACAGGDVFCGVVIGVSEDGYATVQLRGYVTAPYTGTKPDLGYAKLAAGSDGVAVNNNGREYLVIDVDETAGTVGFYM